MNLIDKDFIEGLQKGDSALLEKIYVNYRNEFFGFAKKYQLKDDEILDVYQDAILALRENAVLGKIKPSKTKVKTYFFSIGKYMVFEALRKKKKMYLTSEFKEEQIQNEYDFLFQKSLNSRQQKLQKAFQKLGEKCKQILTLFYYNNYALDEINEEMHYNNKNVVKSQKNRCLKSLKDHMHND